MSYVVEVTDPIQKQFSVTYEPETFECETPEEAAVVYQRELGCRLDLGVIVERLADGRALSQVGDDRQTVTVRELEPAGSA